mmetsp:Transcript_24409/g.67852  ORF Transcript_24409/g.67852 Transcript_24409/m.67852 type:complete len:203 (+) Transcript_24409:1717-2325(+)
MRPATFSSCDHPRRLITALRATRAVTASLLPRASTFPISTSTATATRFRSSEEPGLAPSGFAAKLRKACRPSWWSLAPAGKDPAVKSAGSMASEPTQVWAQRIPLAHRRFHVLVAIATIRGCSASLCPETAARDREAGEGEASMAGGRSTAESSRACDACVAWWTGEGEPLRSATASAAQGNHRCFNQGPRPIVAQSSWLCE